MPDDPRKLKLRPTWPTIEDPLRGYQARFGTERARDLMQSVGQSTPWPFDARGPSGHLSIQRRTPDPTMEGVIPGQHLRFDQELQPRFPKPGPLQEHPLMQSIRPIGEEVPAGGELPEGDGDPDAYAKLESRRQMEGRVREARFAGPPPDQAREEAAIQEGSVAKGVGIRDFSDIATMGPQSSPALTGDPYEETLERGEFADKKKKLRLLLALTEAGGAMGEYPLTAGQVMYGPKRRDPRNITARQELARVDAQEADYMDPAMRRAIQERLGVDLGGETRRSAIMDIVGPMARYESSRGIQQRHDEQIAGVAKRAQDRLEFEKAEAENRQSRHEENLELKRARLLAQKRKAAQDDVKAAVKTWKDSPTYKNLTQSLNEADRASRLADVETQTAQAVLVGILAKAISGDTGQLSNQDRANFERRKALIDQALNYVYGITVGRFAPGHIQEIRDMLTEYKRVTRTSLRNLAKMEARQAASIAAETDPFNPFTEEQYEQWFLMGMSLGAEDDESEAVDNDMTTTSDTSEDEFETFSLQEVEIFE